MTLKALLRLTLVGTSVFCLPCEAKRKVLTPTITTVATGNNGYGTLLYLGVELVNISSVDQNATVKILNRELSHVVSFDTLAAATANLVTWNLVATYFSRSILGNLPDLSKTFFVPKNGRAKANWSISCPVKDVPIEGVCVIDNENIWVGINIPFIANTIGGRSNSAISVSVEINEDRGAVLGSVSLNHAMAFNLTGNSVFTRDINGGRPF